MPKCPTCGGFLKQRNFTNLINSLKLSRSKKTNDAIDMVLKELSKFYTVRSEDVFAFFTETKNFQGIVIRRGIEVFIQRKLAEQGYGIRYLLGIIKNENKTHAQKIEWERRTLDRLPPVHKQGD